MTKRYLPLLAWFAVGGLPSVALAQPVGPEFRVNTYTRSEQRAPSVASDRNGNFVVVWSGASQEEGGGVVGQRYDSDGNRLGGEFQVNTFIIGSQQAPSVAVDADGKFVVVWQGQGRQDGVGIFGQRYDSDGTPLGEEFRVNTYTASNQGSPRIASADSGNFTVVWQSDTQDGSGYGVFGQRFESHGSRLGGEFQVNAYTNGDQQRPSVAAAATGNFVVAWDSEAEDIFGQRYDSEGNTVGGEFRINKNTAGRHFSPSVTSDPNGNVIVVWNKYDEVYGQRYDSNGRPLGDNFWVTSGIDFDQQHPSVSSDAVGNFVVVWEQYTYYGSTMPSELSPFQASLAGEPTNLTFDAFGIFGQRYDSKGKPVGQYFQVNTSGERINTYPAVSADVNGNFRVVWESRFLGIQDHDIFGQRFSAGCEASVQVQGAFNTAGTVVPVQVHIAHHRPEAVTVRWKLSLLDGSGQVTAEYTSSPHTFEPGDVVDQEVHFQLPEDLGSGEYTLDLAVKQMAGTKGARTILQVVRAE